MKAVKQYENAFNALGDPTRRAIFEKLRNGPLAVVRISEGMRVTRPAVSQHLKVLRQAKLISGEQKGTRCFYQIDREGLLGIREYLDKFWDEALVNFKRIAEETQKQKQNK